MIREGINSTKCIILKYTEYKDNTYIVQMYAEEYGVISISIKVSKRSKFRMAYLYPLSRLDCVLSVRSSRDIHSLSECSFRGIQNTNFSPASAMLKMFLAEILVNTLREQTIAEGELFDFIDSSIDFLENNSANTLNFHLIFLIQYTRFLGFFPNIGHFSKGVMFDLENSSFCKEIPMHNMYLTSEQSISFANLLRASYKTMHLFELKRQERNETLNHMMQYYRLHIPEFKEPKSLEVLRSI